MSIASLGGSPEDQAPEFELPAPRSTSILDVVLSVVALIIFAPLMLLIAIAIRIDSPGPVFFTQDRIGLNRRRRNQVSEGADRRQHVGYGRPFKVYKFRSMIVDAEKNTGAVWALRKDPRSTRVGAFLRQTHLDEVPQFINVLRGEMKIVGPRPERLELVRKLIVDLPEYELRTCVLPGITGLAQIRNGYDDSLESASRKVQYDLDHIRNTSLRHELHIIAATALVFLRGKERA